MEVDHNRALAWRVILGDDESESVQRDITTVAVGIEAQARLRHVGQTMGAGWLEGRPVVAAQVRAPVRAGRHSGDHLRRIQLT